MPLAGEPMVISGEPSNGQEPGVKKRGSLYSLCAAAVSVCGLVLGAAPASASIRNTPGYVHIVNAGSGKCIDATDAGAVQWLCLNTFNEEWQYIDVSQFVDVPPGRSFEIVSHASGDCLTEADAGPGGFVNGTPVVLAPCQPGGQVVAAQVWGARNPEQAPLTLANTSNGAKTCLDLENGDTSDGVPMQMWTCNFSTNNQRWRKL
jgi:hypothetical protein